MTGQEYINEAFSLLGLDDIGNAAAGPDANTALGTLNRMLSSWSMEFGPIFEETQETLTLTANDESYGIGSGGDFSTTRPEKILKLMVVVSSSDHRDVEVISNDEYQGIQNKTITGIPRVVGYNPQYPLGVLYFWPIPDSGYTIRLTSLKKYATATLSGTFYVPSGVDNAICYNLAVMLAPKYGVNISPLVLEEAVRSKAALKLNNMTVENLELDPLLPTGSNVPLPDWRLGE